MKNTTIVSVSKIDEKSRDGFRRAVCLAVNEACDLANIIKPGSTVLLKPNVFAPFPAPVTTNPQVIRAVVELCREAGAGRVIVGEGRSISTAKYRPRDKTTRECFKVIGLFDALDGLEVEYCYFEEDESCEVALPDGEIAKNARVPITLLEADVFINLPVMKIHSLTYVTLAIKNLHGMVSDEDKLFGHCYRDARLARKLVDFTGARKPDLNILDASMAQEADHAMPLGRPVEMKVIMASRDIVALDAVASAAMGFDPMEIDTTRIAHERGIGCGLLDEIEIAGESLESIKRHFMRPEISISEEKFPGLRLIAGDYCRSCEYYICRGLEVLQAKGLLDIDQPLTLVLGRNPAVPADIEGPVILAGDCCMESDSIKKLRNHLLLEGRLSYIWACPPMEFRIRGEELLK